jgi:hypothetical protein
MARRVGRFLSLYSGRRSGAQGYVDAGKTYLEYEEPIRDIAGPPRRFGFEDISGLPWTDIFRVKARALLPSLRG